MGMEFGELYQDTLFVFYSHLRMSLAFLINLRPFHDSICLL